MQCKLVSALIALLGIAVSLTAAQDSAIRKDVVYAKVQGQLLHLDLALPVKGDGPFPLVVCFHGGAWQIGHRMQHHGTVRLLAAQGYVAATVQYRLAPKAKFPAQLDDCRAAIAFLRQHAKEYKIDSARIGVLGDSAGGHLALLTGLADDPKSKVAVQAVVNYFGPTDLSTFRAEATGEALFKLVLKGKDSNGLLADFLGTADRKAEIMTRASPLHHVRKGNPPVLTFHGTRDPLVPLEQAKVLHAALKKAGVVEELVILENASHGWGGKLKEQTDRKALDFLDRHLRAKSGP